MGLDGDIGLEYVRSLAVLFKGVGVSARKPDNIARSIKASELKLHVDDVKALVAETVARIENAAQASLDPAP